MTDFSSSSRVVANDLRRAERSINIAARDTAQFLMTAFDVVETHGLSPTFARHTVKATLSALTALVESQEQLAVRAHGAVERAGKALGLTVTNWGEGAPKPAITEDDTLVAEPVCG